jgi:prepilin-type N-terminal cleavage/methylation domain-containing protein
LLPLKRKETGYGHPREVIQVAHASGAAYPRHRNGYADMKRCLSNVAGYSLIELLVALAIFGILAAAAIPLSAVQRERTNTLIKGIVADLRLARASAITSGRHYAFAWINTREYQIQRLQQSGTSWTLDTVITDIRLPQNFLMWTSWPTKIEFNTRGMMVSSNYWGEVALWDSTYQVWRVAFVWPSGQIYEWW